MEGLMSNLIPHGFTVWILLASQNVLCFNPNFGKHSVTHSDITRMAALRIVLKVFQEIPNPSGKALPSDAFQQEDKTLTAEELFEAYYGAKVSVSRFKQALNTMTTRNTKVDIQYALQERRHFDSETLQEGKEVLLSEKARVIQNIFGGNYNRALKNMGMMLHTLQDFYSHSNWIELGFRKPNSNLIKPGVSIGRVAGKTEKTCTDCPKSSTCRDEILGKVIREKIITTGYFGLDPHKKTPGKCCHGGFADVSKGAGKGINKDSLKSPHAEYHREAARVATEASLEAFQDIWDTVGHDAFLRFLNIDSATGLGLSLVIDTTGSMRDDIEAAKQRTINIVNNRRRTRTVPSFYVLVPFNDPDFGPVHKTSDPDKFIEQLRLLSANGGGDTPEMCLSALQLALTNTPPLSHIYVFTDAPAKDYELKDTVMALIEQTKCKVSFLLTNALSRWRRDVSDRFGNQLYKQLAQVSGGLAVIIRRELISQLTSIIKDSTTTAMVIVLQRDNNPDYPRNSFTFPVDTTLQNITIYISGQPAKFTVSSPTGVQQSSSVTSGALASMEHIGDLIIIRLHSPTDLGTWDLVVSSGTPYNVKVTGQSVVDFMYDFIQPFEGPHPGLALLSGRPMAGEESTLGVTVTGLPHYSLFRLRAVALLNAKGQVLQQKPLIPTSSPYIFLIKFQTLPDHGFYIQLTGEGENGAVFHRQSPTLNTVTKTRVKVNAEPSIKVGSSANVSFTITNTGAPSLYKIYTTDDQNFIRPKPQSVFLGTNQSAEGDSIISVPEDARPGTLVTVTVQARSSADLGYSILELTVVSQVEDLRPPTCAIVARNIECPREDRAQCSLRHWSLAARFVSNGTDAVSIHAHPGTGHLARQDAQEGGQRVTLVNYTATCCSPGVVLVGVDATGNVGKCSVSARNQGRISAACSASALLAASLMAFLPK